MKNLKKLTVIAIILWFSLPFGEGWGGAVFSQNVGINQPNPDASALLDLTSTERGLLVPRMTTADRDAITAPIAESLLIYNTTTQCFEAYNATTSTWVAGFCIGCTVPTAVTASASPNPICVGSTLTLTGGATDATSWSWTGPNSYTSASQSPTIAGITTAGAGIYTLVAGNNCGWATGANTASVTVNEPPTTADAGTDIDDLACDATTATLAGNDPSVGTGLWTVESGTATITDNTLYNSGVTGLDVPGVATLRWTISNSPCTPSTDDVVITTTECCPATVDDPDGYTYSTVLIGSQCWFAEDLRYDGSTTGNGCRDVAWVDESDEGCCSYYTGGPFANEGLLYQWSAAMNGSTTPGAQGLCPTGWHIPTDAEWCTLEQWVCNDIGNTGCATTFDCVNTGSLGQNTTTGEGEGSAMAGYEAIWWDNDIDNWGAGNNDFGTSGLNILPSGRRAYSDGTYNDRKFRTYLWSSSESGGSVWKRNLYYTSTQVSRGLSDNMGGYTVRCLKD